jgi:hypothetical protein
MALERKASRWQVERIEMFARMQKACLPQLCEEATFERAQVPQALTETEANFVLTKLRRMAQLELQARRTDAHADTR